ncbi:hypothetical protein [Acinetobacter schindleri]|uniref:hypothetical protein n=1 Tax=Acinetobacter schindleri TaxID=108981 RepID=UPI0013B0812E|nr:hypothetical protein [Acinetobacter schindleri]QIC63299.1 hypothetical protein FSC11_02520 [Acinetobacter schindleri]
MAYGSIEVQISVKLSKRRKLLLIALAAADKIIQLKTTDKLRNLIINRSIKLVPVKHEEGTPEGEKTLP